MDAGPIIALIYDFDGTLAAGNMQEYDFIPTVGKSNAEFWNESNVLAEEADADPILAYMWKMLHSARCSGLRLLEDSFRASGASITLYPGVEAWFDRINAYGVSKGLRLYHYINSSGLREMIEGTAIADRFRKIYASSFLYDENGEAYWPAVAVNYTNKTQFIFKINKGVESVYDSHEVNKSIPEEKRPIQFRHMIYFGDGTTDIPCMRLVKAQGGNSIAVFDPSDKNAASSSERLVKDGRVSFVCPADYSAGSEIETVVKTIIDKIVSDLRLEELKHQL